MRALLLSRQANANAHTTSFIYTAPNMFLLFSVLFSSFFYPHPWFPRDPLCLSLQDVTSLMKLGRGAVAVAAAALQGAAQVSGANKNNGCKQGFQIKIQRCLGFFSPLRSELRQHVFQSPCRHVGCVCVCILHL